MRQVTGKDVNEYMKANDCGALDARMALRKQALTEAAQNACTVDELREVLVYLIEITPDHSF